MPTIKIPQKVLVHRANGMPYYSTRMKSVFVAGTGSSQPLRFQDLAIKSLEDVDYAAILDKLKSDFGDKLFTETLVAFQSGQQEGKLLVNSRTNTLVALVVTSGEKKVVHSPMLTNDRDIKTIQSFVQTRFGGEESAMQKFQAFIALEKLQPPRPGLVPKSGDWNKPFRWIRSEEKIDLPIDVHQVGWTGYVGSDALEKIKQEGLVVGKYSSKGTREYDKKFNRSPAIYSYSFDRWAKDSPQISGNHFRTAVFIIMTPAMQNDTEVHDSYLTHRYVSHLISLHMQRKAWNAARRKFNEDISDLKDPEYATLNSISSSNLIMGNEVLERLGKKFRAGQTINDPLDSENFDRELVKKTIKDIVHERQVANLLKAQIVIHVWIPDEGIENKENIEKQDANETPFEPGLRAWWFETEEGTNKLLEENEQDIEKAKVAFHEHDSFIEHPVAVKDHEKWFSQEKPHFRSKQHSAQEWVRPKGKKSPLGLPIPPGRSNIWVPKQKNYYLQIVSTDYKGLTQYKYTSKHDNESSASKYSRFKKFARFQPTMDKLLARDIGKYDEADVLYAISVTAIRIGSDRETLAAHKAYGMSTLRSSHVSVRGNTVHVNFPAKKGTSWNMIYEDATLARIFKNRIEAVGEDDRLFQTNDDEVRKYMHAISGDRFSPKDYRYLIGTLLAMELMKGIQTPTDPKQLKAAKKEIFAKVAKELNNTPGVAEKAYVAKEIFAPWEAASVPMVQIKKSFSGFASLEEMFEAVSYDDDKDFEVKDDPDDEKEDEIPVKKVFYDEELPELDPEEQENDDEDVDEVGAIEKHLQGQHDQSKHGNEKANELPNASQELYDYQWSKLERPTKLIQRINTPNNVAEANVGFRLENAGDAFREIAKPNFSSEEYIEEKLNRIEHSLIDSEWKAPLSDKGKSALENLKKTILEAPVRTERHKAAQQLMLDVADRNLDAIKQDIQQIRGLELEKSRVAYHEHDGWQEHPVRVGDHKKYFVGEDKEPQPIFETGKAIKVKLYRGMTQPKEGESFASDPGDLGAGEYWTTDIHTARAYSHNVEEQFKEFKNPLVLSGKLAGKLAEKYNTIHGTIQERLEGARKLSDDLRTKGYDALVAENYDSPKGTFTVVVLNAKQAEPKWPIVVKGNLDKEKVEKIFSEIPEKWQALIYENPAPLTIIGDERKKTADSNAAHRIRINPHWFSFGRALVSEVYPGTGIDSDNFGDIALLHEFGHSVYFALTENDNLRAAWADASRGYGVWKEQGKLITKYSAQGAHEFFAECIVYYLRAPEILKKVHPTVFSFFDKLLEHKQIRKQDDFNEFEPGLGAWWFETEEGFNKLLEDNEEEIEKARVAFHTHDGMQEHPVAVKDHQEYFNGGEKQDSLEEIFSHASPELDETISVLSKYGKPYVVGGSLRDALLGKSPKDYDIEVYGIPAEKLGQILSDELGAKREQVGKQFGVFKVGNIDISLPRTESKIGEKHTDFNVAHDPNLSPRDAAKRRDFTINAMLYDSGRNELLDFFGGQEDLKNKIIKHVDAKTFVEDPLRVYRAAQFAARLGFSIDPETIKLASEIDLSSLPPERVYEEFKKIMLMSDKPSIGLQALDDMHVLEKHYPELNVLKDNPQSTTWHAEGSTYNHSLMALDKAAELIRSFPNEKDKTIIMLTTLLHDIGKPATTEDLGNGRITQHGHSEAGIEPAKKFLAKLTNEKDVVDDVLMLIEQHLIPLQWYEQRGSISESAFKRAINRFGIRRLELLAAVSEADSTGRLHRTESGERIHPTNKEVEWFRSRIKEIIDESGTTASGTIPPLITGDDLLDIGFKTGKTIGEILRDVKSQQEEGSLTDKNAALRYVKEHYDVNLQKADTGFEQYLDSSQPQNLEIETHEVVMWGGWHVREHDETGDTLRIKIDAQYSEKARPLVIFHEIREDYYMRALALPYEQAHKKASEDEKAEFGEKAFNSEVGETRDVLAQNRGHKNVAKNDEVESIEKLQPPRPGLVPQSGDYEHPYRWIKPEDDKQQDAPPFLPGHPKQQTINLYHGGIINSLPEKGWIDFTTDEEVAKNRAAHWKEKGKVFEIEIPVDGKKSLDKRFSYMANMPMSKPGHGQYQYKVGTIKEAIAAKRKAIEEAGEEFEIKKADISLSVKAIILDENGKLLLLRNNPKYSEFEFDLPGGHYNGTKDIDEEAALRREVLEETGLTVTSIEDLDIGGDVRIGQDNHPVLFYKAEVEPGDIKTSKEHIGYSWVFPEDLNEIDLGAFKEPLEDYFETKKKYDGGIIALVPLEEISKQLEIPGGIPWNEMHITLAYMKYPWYSDPAEIVKELDFPEFQGKIRGYERFEGHDDKGALVALIDVPELDNFRTQLTGKLIDAGFSLNDFYSFKPHITLAYIEKGQEYNSKVSEEFSKIPIIFKGVEVWNGDDKSGIVRLYEHDESVLQKLQPPRPGLVPKSGDYEHPYRWILPSRAPIYARQKKIEDTKKWLVAKFPQSAFSESEKKAFNSYITGVSYIEINKALRQNNPWPRPSVVDGLDSIFSKARTSEDIMVYRGLKKYSGKLHRGDVLLDKGFVSTSIESSIAYSFSAGEKNETSILLEIFLPKGSSAIRGELHEYEVILPRNSKFVVEDVQQQKDKFGFNSVIARVRLVTE